MSGFISALRFSVVLRTANISDPRLNASIVPHCIRFPLWFIVIDRALCLCACLRGATLARVRYEVFICLYDNEII